MSVEKRISVEKKIVRKAIRALKSAGTPVVNVFDGEELVPVSTEAEILDAVFSVDESRMITADGDWVYVVLGNDYDCLSDYTLDLEEALNPVYDWIDKHDGE
jgi:hypothetical protein